MRIDALLKAIQTALFRPNANVTRAEMAKMMIQAFGLTSGANSSFKDVDPLHWAIGYIYSSRS
ncbi:S-layer homology domain-containing protein [Lysinibacillus sp. NPDC094403]|uniref:S-layer homology domain-containing protein n=1 Tax=Lysinibacillus sp. NPDC094403 TaxID=3390581 RepID=UPI003D077BEE